MTCTCLTRVLIQTTILLSSFLVLPSFFPSLLAARLVQLTLLNSGDPNVVCSFRKTTKFLDLISFSSSLLPFSILPLTLTNLF